MKYFVISEEDMNTLGNLQARLRLDLADPLKDILDRINSRDELDPEIWIDDEPTETGEEDEFDPMCDTCPLGSACPHFGHPEMEAEPLDLEKIMASMSPDDYLKLLLSLLGS